MAEPRDFLPSIRPWTLILAGLVAGFAAALIPLIPDSVRPWNFAAFGAAGLFVAARSGRFGFLLAIAVCLGSKLMSDLFNYRQHGYDPAYLPAVTVYFALMVYAALGWSFLRRTENLLRIGGVTIGGSVLFFLVTNAFSWIGKALPYNNGISGLLEAYLMGLPFLWGTMLGDLIFGGTLFGLSAVVNRDWSADATLIPVPVEESRR